MGENKGDDGRAEKLAMAKKLQEHLTNLDKVEEALKVTPENPDLRKLKEDLQEIIKLVSNRMLGKRTKPEENQTTANSTTGNSEARESAATDKTDNNKMVIPVVLKDPVNLSFTSVKHVELTDIVSIPNLPRYFYETFEAVEAPPPDLEEGDDDDFDRDISSLSEVAQSYVKRRRRFISSRDAKIRKFLETNSIIMINGQIQIESATKTVSSIPRKS